MIVSWKDCKPMPSFFWITCYAATAMSSFANQHQVTSNYRNQDNER